MFISAREFSCHGARCRPLSKERKVAMTVYGYARVSTKDQNLDRQLDALAQFPVEESLVFTDHMSGRDFNRPGYKKLCERLKPGDVVVVKSIDRLGRNYDEILEQWRTLTKRKSVDVVVIDMPLLDTRVVDKDVTGVFIADLVLQLLSYVAQVERDNTKQRQAEGIAAARARGVRFGRPPKRVPDDFGRVRELWRAGEISAREAARRLGVSRSTFEKWANSAAA